MVDIFRPGCRVRIWTAAEPGEQIEFQMIVAIDEARTNQVPGEIQQRRITGGVSG
jgi:hypothetical protein